jgi:hypothetical protein
MARVAPPVKTLNCHFCGGWPATQYVDLSTKVLRVCETCVLSERVVPNDQGIFVRNPELPADPAEPQS